MPYCSTRGGVADLNFEDAVMMGLADDGGLLVPTEIPDVTSQLAAWRKLSFPEMSYAVMSAFLQDEIPSDTLRQMIDRSYAAFRTPEVTPVVSVGAHHVLELFHGPTFAFKDVALQFLGNLFEYILEKRGTNLRILGATSGDTGSAAIHGVRRKRGLEIFMLHPFGKVSPVQELQMITVTDDNVHNLAIDGNFDDAQNLVKALFNDAEFKQRQHLGAVNSINWARVLAQIVYYFYAHARVAQEATEPVSFSVPTGNFGNVLAGYYAQQMGLPVETLLVATNENDILHRLFDRGEYHREAVRETWSPSMDIQISSNLERYLYALSGNDAATLSGWMQEFQSSGKLTLSGAQLATAQRQFSSARVSSAETIETIRKVHAEHGYLLDPHSAIGYAAAEKIPSDSKVISLACAHPAKFAKAIEAAIGSAPEEPEALAALRQQDTRSHRLAGTTKAVRAYLESIPVPA